MHSNVTFQNWIDHLRYLMPPQGVVHVGAGTGASAMRYANWSVSTSVLIEAEESNYQKLTQAVSGHKGWSAYTAMLSDKEEDAVYYKVSNLSESGSLPPEVMAKLWRNLKTIEERRLITTTLERLLITAGILSDCLNWLVIDCLPALPILQGAGKYMDGWDVIIARVLLDENLCPGNGAAKMEIDSLLSTQGFRCIAIEEERLPAIANALYIRDWKIIQNKSLEIQGKIQQLTQARDEQAKLAADWQTQIQQLTQAREEQAKLAAERQTQIQQLTQARDEQAKLAADWQTQIQQLTQAREEQAKLAADRQTQLQQLTQAREEQTKQATERQAQIQQLTQARDEQAKELGKLSQDLSDARKTVSLSVKLQTLREADLKDLQARYQVSLSTQDEQHQLLAKLGEKLSVLADYFHQIANEEITLTSDKEEKPKPVKKISQSRTKRKLTGKARKGN